LKQSYNLCIRLECMQWSNWECRPSVWSATAENFNEIRKVKARLREVLQITSAQQHAPIGFILPRLKLNRTGGLTHRRKKYKIRSMRSTKSDRLNTNYKDTMRPQQAIRSNTEHICTTMFIRRRILRVFPFVTRIRQPHTDSIPGCFIRPQTHIHTWKLEWSNYVNTSAHSAAG